MTVPALTQSTTRGAPARRSLLLAASVCLMSFAAFWTAQRAAGVSIIDLMVYRAEGRAVLDGQDLYAMRATAARLPTTYPPFAALLFTALTLPGVPGLRTLATAGNLLLLVVFVRFSLRLTLRRTGRCPAGTTLWITALWVASAAVWCEPVWTTLRYGQINLLLATAVLWDLSRRDGHRWAGVGIGLAAAVKLTPALFAVLPLLVGLLQARRAGRRWNPWLRQAATAAAVFGAATLTAAVVLPRDSLRFWTSALFEADRVGRAESTANQSLRGVLARLLSTGDPALWWAGTAAVVAAAGLTVAVGAALRGERAGAMAACAATALLISPVSWSHHWVWCVPMVLFVAGSARARWAAAAGLVFCSYALWWVPHGPGGPELTQSGAEMTLSALYPLTALAVLGQVAVQVYVPGRRRSGQAVANE
ncbi:glycosyltransferase 87 family protein [Streptomyces sp. AK02-01A]|uniref:glycosyltransferase 87 family protein n=1 Tax=Streptomyces sp. AK02-01A TaxID=3028648 RepID=UPI0029B95F8A|nr:glycosyltransferase 87 family protein [Streptomyces sp. AK02-01A]MDX3849368.1 glycosyltransferase 87 family protein [Streptomyces sp. AK02-01A]